MEEKILLRVLQVMKNGESMEVLSSLGLDYYTISKYLKYALEKKYIEVYTEYVELTESGKNMISKLSLQYDNNKNGFNIRPLFEKRIKKIDKFDIYIAKK